MPSQRVEHILILRLAALGDVARATALLARIKSERPAAHVTWVVGNSAAPLLALVPGIDRIVRVSDERLFGGSPVRQVMEVTRLWVRLADTTFDAALLAHPDRRYRVLLAGVRARKTRTLAAPSRASTSYVGDEFAQLLDETPVQPGQYPVADLREAVASVPIPDAACFAPDRPYAILIPGGARNLLRDDPLRRWPVESYVSLAKALLAKDVEVALLGGPSDDWVRPSFAGTGVRDLIGQLSLPQTLRVMSGPGAVVSHDTGPLHLAHLVRARIVALFGPTVPSRVVGAAENVVALWGGKHLHCRPCYDGVSFAPCMRNLCMEDIAVDDVLRTVEATICSPG